MKEAYCSAQLCSCLELIKGQIFLSKNSIVPFLFCNSYCSSLVISTVVNVHVVYCIERSYANTNDLQVMKVVRSNFFFFLFLFRSDG